MIDIVDKVKRSQMMSGIRSSNTKPEILTRKALHRLGYRFRLDSKIGRIKPDIVLRSRKVAVFIHGCYWHQHEGCKLAYSDRVYDDMWLNKFEANKQRDKRVVNDLIQKDWRVVVIWECVTRNSDVFTNEINNLHDWIQSQSGQYYESNYRKT